MGLQNLIFPGIYPRIEHIYRTVIYHIRLEISDVRILYFSRFQIPARFFAAGGLYGDDRHPRYHQLHLIIAFLAHQPQYKTVAFPDCVLLTLPISVLGRIQAIGVRRGGQPSCPFFLRALGQIQNSLLVKGKGDLLIAYSQILSPGQLFFVLQDGLVLHQCDSHNLIRAKGPALSPFHRFHARYHDDAEHSYHGQPYSLPISPRHFFPAPFQPRFPQMPNPFSQPVNRSLPRHGTAMLPTLSCRCPPRP